jgi:hypothetical protein
VQATLAFLAFCIPRTGTDGWDLLSAQARSGELREGSLMAKVLEPSFQPCETLSRGQKLSAPCNCLR